MQHYFVNELLAVDQPVTLGKDESHHLSKVLRAKVGDQVELVSSNQELFLAQITAVDKLVVCLPTVNLEHNVELPVDVTIVSGLSKANKPELIVQKATELGVREVIFTPMARSIVKWDQKAVKKIERLNQVAKSAAEQSHRNQVPQVKYVSSIKELSLDYDAKIVAYEEVAKQNEAANLVKAVNQCHNGQSIIGIFGPEGGIADEEVTYLQANGYQLAGLGPRIMRAETAPLYFLAAISTLVELN